MSTPEPMAHPVPKPLGTYVPLIQQGNLVMTSGLLPMKDGVLLTPGQVGHAVTLEEANAAARQCALNALALFEHYLGSLDRIHRMVSVTGYVQAASGFAQHPQVMNGASDTLVAQLGDRGQHVRTAVGVASLPLNSCVEVSFVAELAD